MANQKNLVKVDVLNSICPKWHFGQIGQGGKKSIRYFIKLFFLVIFLKNSCNHPQQM
jgi:hypothetical protein